MPDVSALLQQMQQTLTAIHETITSLDPKVHDEKLDALEAERDDILAKLLAAFEKESADLTEKRKHERDEIAEKRRKEDEEIAARRKREDDELNSRDLTNDSEREQKLETEKHHVEESTDSKMEQIEDEAQRAMDEAHEKLRQLEGKRQEIHRLIDEQMKAPLPAPPKRKRRGTVKSAQKGPVFTIEASQPESQDRSVAVEAQDSPESVVEQERAKDVEPAEPKQEANASEEPAVEVEEVSHSQTNEPSRHPENSIDAKEAASEETGVQDDAPAEAPQSEGLTVAEASAEARIEKELPAEEPAAEASTAEHPATAKPAREIDAEEVPSSKEFPKEGGTEETPSAEPSTETESKLEGAGPSEPAADAPATDKLESPEKPVAEEHSTAGAASEEPRVENTTAEEVPPKGASVEDVEADKAATVRADSQDSFSEKAPVGISATQDATDTKEPPPNEEVSTSQSRDVGGQAENTSAEVPVQVQHAVQDQQADNTSSTVEDESEPRDLGTKQEKLPDSQDTESAVASVMDKAETKPETARDVPEESLAPLQHPGGEKIVLAEHAEDQRVKEDAKTSEVTTETMEQSKSPSGLAESAWLSGKTSPREAIDQEEPTREADSSSQEIPAKNAITDSDQQEHTEAATKEAENSGATTDTVEGSAPAAGEHFVTAETEVESQHDSSEPPKSDHLPTDDGLVADIHTASPEDAIPDFEKPPSNEKLLTKEDPAASDYPQERDTAAVHETQPEKGESQGGEFAENTPLDVNEHQSEEKPKVEGHSEEGQDHIDGDADRSHTDSTEKSNGEPRLEQHPEPTLESSSKHEQEYEPKHEPSEIAHQDPESEQTTGAQDKEPDNESPRDAESGPEDNSGDRASHEEASISDHHVEASAEEITIYDAPSVDAHDVEGPVEKTEESPEPQTSNHVRSSEPPVVDTKSEDAQDAPTSVEENSTDGVHTQATNSDKFSAAAPSEGSSTATRSVELTNADTSAAEGPVLQDPTSETPAAEGSATENSVEKDAVGSPVKEGSSVDAPATGISAVESTINKESAPSPTFEESYAEEPAQKQTAKEEPSQEEPAKEEPAQEEPAQEEPAQKEPAQEKPAQEEPAEEEPTREEPTREEPTREEPTREEPTREEPAQEAAQKEPVQEEPSQEEPAQEEPAHEEPAHEEPAQEELIKEEPVQEEPAEEEPTREEPTREEPTREEPTREEPTREEPAQEAAQKEPVQEEPSQEEPAHEEPAEEEPTREEPAQEAAQKEPVQEEPSQEEPAQEAAQKEPAQEEPTREEPAQEEADKEGPPKEELLTQSPATTTAVEETQSHGPAAEVEADAHTQDTAEHSAEKTDETPRQDSVTETPQNESLQPNAASAESPTDAPVQASVEQTGVPYAADTSTEAAIDKAAPVQIGKESSGLGDDSTSPHNNVQKNSPTAEAQENEKRVQLVEDPEKITHQGSGLNSEPQEINRDDHAAESEPSSTEGSGSLPADSKEIIQSDEPASDEHDIGEKLSDSGYDSALTASRTLDDATSVPGQHQHEEALASVQEDIIPTDEPHPAAQQLEAEIQDQKEQPEIHEGAGNVISPSKGGDVQESGNSQAAETLEDGDSEHTIEKVERKADNTGGPESDVPAAEQTKAVAGDQPPISSERADHQDDNPSQAQQDTAPRGIDANQPNSTQGPNVQGDDTFESHEDKGGNIPKGDSEQIVLDGPAAMKTETDGEATSDSQDVADSDGKFSDSLERNVSSLEPAASGQLVQEQPQQDTVEDQQACIPATAVDETKPGDKVREEEQDPSHENLREGLENQDTERNEVVQDEVPQSSFSNRRQSRPTIEMTPRATRDDPDEGLFAVPPTPRQEVDQGKPEHLEDNDTTHDRPEDTLDAKETDLEVNPPQEEHVVEVELPPKADRPDDKSPKEAQQTEQPNNLNEPQGEQRHLADNEDAATQEEPVSTTEDAPSLSDSDEKDDHPQMGVLTAPQVHDSQPTPEPKDVATSQGKDEDTHASEPISDPGARDDLVDSAESNEIGAQSPLVKTTVDHEIADTGSSPEDVDVRDRSGAAKETRASDIESSVEKNLSESVDSGLQEDAVDDSPHEPISLVDPSNVGHVEEDGHESAQHAAYAPPNKVDSDSGSDDRRVDEPHEKYHAQGDDASQPDGDAGAFSHTATASKHEMNTTFAPGETNDADLKAQGAPTHVTSPAIEQQQDLGADAERFEEALEHLPDESAHTVQGTDQLFDDDYEDESESEYGEAMVSPPERIIYQAHGDDSNVALGGNRSSLSLGRNSIESARSLGHRSRESRGSVGSVQPTTPVRLTDGSYLPGANIVRADWAAEHEEELRPSHRGTPLLEPSTAQDTAEISPFALRNASPTEGITEDRGLSSSRWNTERPSTPPSVPSKKFNNPFRFQRTPDPAVDSELVPRDVTNVPWHARQDSVPVSLHSQTTLSSVTSSPIHSALPADKHEPVIRDSWAAPAPGYQQYLSSWTGRTRGDSAVSNNSEYDPFRSDTIGGGTPAKSSLYNPLQQRARGESSASAAPSNTSAAASNASPGRGSALFQKMRNIFENQSGPDPNASMEPMRSPHRRPPSGASHPVTPMQRTSSEKLRDEAYDPPVQRRIGSQDEADNGSNERISMLRGRGASYEADHATN